MNPMTNESMQSFIRGYRHGAGAKVKDERFSKNQKSHIADSYNEGYQQGKEAIGLATAQFALRIGYDFQEAILRSTDE